MNPIDKLSPGAKATFGHLRELMTVFGNSAQPEASVDGLPQTAVSSPVPAGSMPKTPIVFTAKVVVDFAQIPFQQTYKYGPEIDRLREMVFQKANSLTEQFDVCVEDGYCGGWRFNLEVIFQAEELAEIAGAVSTFEAWISQTEELKLGPGDSEGS